MLFKTDWKKHLHWIREVEVEKVFQHLGTLTYQKGLEIGCGDGYQTTLISKHCKDFIACDLNFERIKEELKLPNVTYRKCDADNMKDVFASNEFDFIFSSNVLEHLSDPRGFLISTREFLQKEGYAVHIVPSRCVKISYILLYYVDLLCLIGDRLTGLFSGKKIFRGENIYLENNINKADVEKKSKFMKFAFPQIHGNFASHTEEFVKFGRKSWEILFEETGYKVEKYIKGPAFSGYGFGWNPLRKVLTFFGWSSEHIFILRKRDE